MTSQTAMTTSQLDAVLRAIDPRARIVPARILRRISNGQNLTGPLGLHLTHRRSLLVPTESALRWVTPQELNLSDETPLPAVLLLIQEPVAPLSEPDALVWAWRRLFHLRVHLALEEKRQSGSLNPQTVTERTQEIGPGEFAEAKSVLERDSWLMAPEDPIAVYIEFVAVYLELRYFSAPVTPAYFPRIEEIARIDAILAQDIDAHAIFNATQPPGSPQPAPHPPAHHQEPESVLVDDEQESRSEARYRWLLRRADHARNLGNHVRSAILRTRAARLVGRSLAGTARAGAVDDLDNLISRLLQATCVECHSRAALRSAFASLLAKTANSIWNVEGRLLYDLQKVCLDHEREVFNLQPWRWLFSRGRVPLQKPLPNQKLIRASQHLRQAQGRLAHSQLDAADREALAKFLAEANEAAEHHVRERFRPLICRSLERAELVPRNLPEQVSFDRMSDELLDRVVDRSYLTMGEVRDAVARSDLRQPDLASPVELARGDRVLRANRRLRVSLEGVYHPGEIYLRTIQRISLLTFGTAVGRWLVWYIALPFGGAFGALKTVEELLHIVRFHYEITNLWSIGILGTFLLLLIHSKAFRNFCAEAGKQFLKVLHAVLIQGPAWVMSLPIVRAVIASRWFEPLRRLLILPATCGAITYLLVSWLDRDRRIATGLGLGAFVLTSFFLGTSVGREMEEYSTDALIRGWHRFRMDLIPGLGRFIMDVFDAILETVERVIYAVDEMLRFKSGEGRLTLYAKAVLGEFWGAVTYIIRIYVNLLVEPTVNPLKHFPTVTVAAKMIIPILPRLYDTLYATFHFLGKWPAGGIAAVTVLFLPGLAGFVVWELKENWRLFEANRPKNLQPVMIGHHGESMRRLLLPGFHSGTIPKLFAKLRRAERKAYLTGEHAKARAAHDALHHVEEPIRHFVERGFLATLIQSGRFSESDLTLTKIRMATNQVALALSTPSTQKALRIAFDSEDGKLISRITDDGWRTSLELECRRVLDAALIVMSARAGSAHLIDPDEPVAELQTTLGDDKSTPERLEVRWTRWVDFWASRSKQNEPEIATSSPIPS